MPSFSNHSFHIFLQTSATIHYDNPKGNVTEAKKVIGYWIERYNREYLHSALGYLKDYYQEAT